jgi:serine protease inhibitor
MTRKSTFTLLLGGAVALAGCESLTGPRSSLAPTFSLADVDARVAHGYTDFSFDVFRSLAAEEPDENIFFSGTSLAFALAMAYHGADGETRREMARVLGVDGVGPDAFNASNAAWLSALIDDPGDAELSIANSVWARLGFPFEQDFLDRNATNYRARVEAIDFDDPATIDTINAWVAEQTRDRIEEIVEEIDPEDVMFLINAVYFLGEWTTPFPEDGTAPQPFRLPNGAEASVPMMTRRDTLEYYAGNGYQAVRLPYGEDERFAMYVFLPDADSDLQAFYDGLDAAEWQQRIGRLEPRDIEFTMPRFTLEYEKQLAPVLAGLGMRDAFSARSADFGLMRPERDIYISEVLQKSFVQVNETGTEAAAVTSVRVRVVSAPSHPIVTVDRPFFFAIRDDRTGTVLFQGQITSPEDPEWDGETG